MSLFYQSIVDHYEAIFQPTPAQLNFLADAAPGPVVLDVACATGLVAQRLAERGFSVTALDLEEAMVKRAQAKTEIRVIQGDMLDLPFADESFDLVYCIGNSIPHLDSLAQILTFYQEASRVLKPEGVLVTQWINFEPFLARAGDDLGELPTISNRLVNFRRRYFRTTVQNQEKIRFHTELKADDQILQNDEILYPLLLEDACHLQMEAGLTQPEVYGAFDGRDFVRSQSVPIITKATKKVR